MRIVNGIPNIFFKKFHKYDIPNILISFDSDVFESMFLMGYFIDMPELCLRYT